MHKNLSPFVLAPIAMLIAMQGSQAMTLGDLQLKSYIGQRFKADIPYRLGANERLLEDCNLIRQTSGDVTYLGAASLQLIAHGDGNSGVIRITSQRPAEEPIIGFALQVECENINLTREFTIFLDPAPVVDVPVVPEKTALAAHNLSIEGKKAQKATIASKDTSLEKIAQRYYSPGSSQYDRYLQKLKRSNPDLAPNEMIAVGSSVYIPPRAKLKPKPLVPATVPIPGAGNGTTSTLEQGLLRLEGAERTASAPAAKASPEAYVKELESKVAELTELRKKLQMEIEALDMRLAQNTGELKANFAASAPVITSAAMAVQHASPVAEAKAEHTAKRTTENGVNWQWPTVGLLGLLGGGVWWWARRRADEDGFDSTVSNSVISVLKTNFAPRHAAVTELSLIQHANSAFQVSDDESSSLEQAQYYLAHGDTLRALELLQQLLEADPQDVERWLMLFRVYRQQGMKSDYIQLAHKFRSQDPKPADDDWELVRSIGYKLAPESSLFARVDAPEPIAPAAVSQEESVDLAIENLSVASQEPQHPTTQNDINLIEVFQPPPKLAPVVAKKLEPTLQAGESIKVPELSVMNHQEDISSLDKLEFEVKEIEFDDEKNGELKQ